MKRLLYSTIGGLIGLSVLPAFYVVVNLEIPNILTKTFGWGIARVYFVLFSVLGVIIANLCIRDTKNG